MFILALEKLVVVACEKKIGQVDFSSLLIGLVSDRPTVLASAMSTYPDLRSLAVRIVYDLLLSHTTKTGENHDEKHFKQLGARLSSQMPPAPEEPPKRVIERVN